MQPAEIPVGDETMKFISRSQWEACEPRHPLEEFGDSPAQYIIIGQCCSKAPCTDTTECCANMRRLQLFHMNDKEFDDVAFNYVVANDGIVYEGRGHQWRAATAKRWNDVAYGVAFMGQFDADSEDCQKALKAAQLLLKYLCSESKLDEEYVLYGLRQVRPFESPDMTLYNVIKTWDHWQPYGEEENVAAAAAATTGL